jgi:hypothetical protein
MATRFDNIADRLSRTTGLPTSTAFTMACWYSRVSSGGTFEAIMTINASGTLLKVGMPSAALTISGASGSTAFTTSYSNNTSFFLAMVSNGSGAGNLVGYAGVPAASLQTASTDSLSATVTDMNFGNNSNADWINGRISGLKAWDVALTADDLQNERWSWLPRRVANLIYFNPGINDAQVQIDWTGNGNLTKAGALTESLTQPQISWGVRRRRIARYIDSAPGSSFPPNSLALTGVGR